MAQRSGFDAVFLNDEGQPLIGLSIRVLDSEGNLAQIYDTKTGTTLKAQPIITAAATNGLVQFWAEPGYYQVEVSDTEIPARISSRVVPFDAVAGDTVEGSEGISLSQLPIITESKIGTNAVTESKIGTNAVTSVKLRDDSSTDSNRAVTTNHIRDNAVTAAKQPDGLYPPVGAIIQFAGSVAAAGWLFCEGQSLTQAAYPNLYAVITNNGTVFPYGGSGSNFNLPDLRGRIPVGTGTHSTVNALGKNDGTAVANRRPAHAHSLRTGRGGTFAVHESSGGTGNSSYYTTGTFSPLQKVFSSTSMHTSPADVDVAVGPLDSPSFVVVNYIIRF